MNCRWSIVALLDTNITVGLVIVACFYLKLYPSGRDQLPSLNSAFE